MGGLCLAGECSADAADCQPEFVRLRDTPVELTYENAFLLPFPTARRSELDPDDFIVRDEVDDPGDRFPPIPVRVGTDRVCSAGCERDSDCETLPGGECTACTLRLGGPPRSEAVANLESFYGTALCRQRCVPTDVDNGGCADGYTCDPFEYVCVEACVSDAQCQARLMSDLESGTVAWIAEDSRASCGLLTGRCEWTAEVGPLSACDSDLDCPDDHHVCLARRCIQTGCEGSALGNCSAERLCVGSLNAGGLCLDRCAGGPDCPADHLCVALRGEAGGVCVPNAFGLPCEPGDCGVGEQCADVDGTGQCVRSCEPGGEDCGPHERCEFARDIGVPRCRAVGGFCRVPEDCTLEESCLVLGDDVNGTCVASCRDDGDCAPGTRCRVQGDGRGVCRVPDGACALSPLRDSGEALLPLRGDPQCLPDQRCAGSQPNALSGCVNR
jgi:hypothetical protein